MKVEGVVIEDRIKEKILNKHNIEASEIKEALFSRPLILRSRRNRYLAISFSQRYLTLVFEIKDKIAFIVTAYPSSEAQKRLYKNKRK